MPINISPNPTGGQGPFGAVPGLVDLPNPYADLSQVLPGLGGLNTQLTGVLGNQMAGRLSPETQKNIQDFAATQASRGGMPGTGMRSGALYGNRTLRDLGLTTEQLQQQGLQNYNQLIPTISRTQTVDPATQISLAQSNALNRAAPDPAQAAAYAKTLFDQYLAAMRRPSGPAGGTGQYASPVSAPVGPAGPSTQPSGYPFNTPSVSGGYQGALQGNQDYITFPDGTIVDPFTGQMIAQAPQGYDPLDEVFGTDPGTIQDIGNWWDTGAPEGTVSTDYASYAPGSPDTYWNPTDTSSLNDFVDSIDW